MPTNIFGINGKYDFENSHVIIAMILKFYTAKKLNKKSHFMGRWQSKREFIYSDDVAKFVWPFCLSQNQITINF